MNSKGQSFDVFQLLIAAVVAGAILVILLNIIGGVLPPGTSNVNAEASNLVKTGVNTSYGSPTSKGNISMDNKTFLNPITIAQGTDISSDDICVTPGDFISDGSNDLFSVQGRAIKYNGSGSKKVGLTVVCGRGADLTEAVGFLTDDPDAWYDGEYCGDDWVDSCTDEASSQTCCLVALRNA